MPVCYAYKPHNMRLLQAFLEYTEMPRSVRRELLNETTMVMHAFLMRRSFHSLQWYW